MPPAAAELQTALQMALAEPGDERTGVPGAPRDGKGSTVGTQRAPPGGKGSPVTEGRARLKRYMLVPLPVAVTQHRAGSAPVPRLGWASLISSAITTRHCRGHCPLALACSALRHSSPRSPKTPTAAEPGAPPRALAPAFLTLGSHPAGFASRWAALAPPAWCGLADGEGSSVCEVSCGRPGPPPPPFPR